MIRTSMRAGAVALLAGLLGAGCAGPGADPPEEAERAQVIAGAEAALARFFAASNELDTERLLAAYQADAGLVQVACTTVRRGFGTVAPLLRLWHEDRPDITLRYEVIRTEPLGPNAAVIAAQGRNQDGLALFWTFVLRRDDAGDWRIVQEHQSWSDCREPRRHP